MRPGGVAKAEAAPTGSLAGAFRCRAAARRTRTEDELQRHPQAKVGVREPIQRWCWEVRRSPDYRRKAATAKRKNRGANATSGLVRRRRRRRAEGAGTPAGGTPGGGGRGRRGELARPDQKAAEPRRRRRTRRHSRTRRRRTAETDAAKPRGSEGGGVRRRFRGGARRHPTGRPPSRPTTASSPRRGEKTVGQDQQLASAPAPRTTDAVAVKPTGGTGEAGEDLRADGDLVPVTCGKIAGQYVISEKKVLYQGRKSAAPAKVRGGVGAEEPAVEANDQSARRGRGEAGDDRGVSGRPRDRHRRGRRKSEAQEAVRGGSNLARSRRTSGRAQMRWRVGVVSTESSWKFVTAAGRDFVVPPKPVRRATSRSLF